MRLGEGIGGGEPAMETTRKGRLAFDDFRHILASELKLDVEKIVPEASFYTDLRFGPACIVDTMLRLEDRGIDIPLELAWQIDTVRDAYQVMIYRRSH
jgi:acyl carrier protein